jgi:Na+-translocating ferredoxin:NAD+ oxidoreductase RnfC subunit
MSLADTLRTAGVVGAGGGGFPAYVKAASKVDVVIANGAECEPLIHKDYELMVRFSERVVRGLELLMEATGAKEGIIGIKAKNTPAIEALTPLAHSTNIRIQQLGDFYPSGDEYILVYEATRRLIPPQGIPLNVGVVVSNVETLCNIANATNGQPVTQKFITVAGAVKHPVSFVAPIGMSVRDAIATAGGASIEHFGVFIGGIMMGTLVFDIDQPITKTTAGLVVLPMDHTLVQRKRQPESAMHRIGRSACDQCSYCTELCPRYVLGYDVQPHKVMRSLGFASAGENLWNQYAALCCACGLCTLYACPENLFPKEACDRSKLDLKKHSIPWEGRREVVPHPMYEGRRTPLKQLIRRLGIVEYDHPSEFYHIRRNPARVAIPLQQHVGVPAQSVVHVGDRVKVGQCVGEMADGNLGANVHASIDGEVTVVGESIVVESE